MSKIIFCTDYTQCFKSYAQYFCNYTLLKMRAVAYSIKSFEKEPLAKANHKKHDITLISNPLTIETAEYASGKDAVIISDGDALSDEVLKLLSSLQVNYIINRAFVTTDLNRAAATRNNIKLVSVLSQAEEENLSLYDIARCIIEHLDGLQENKSSF